MDAILACPTQTGKCCQVDLKNRIPVAVQKPELREEEGAAGDERVPGPHRLPDELRPVMRRWGNSRWEGALVLCPSPETGTDPESLPSVTIISALQINRFFLFVCFCLGLCVCAWVFGRLWLCELLFIWTFYRCGMFCLHSLVDRLLALLKRVWDNGGIVAVICAT